MGCMTNWQPDTFWTRVALHIEGANRKSPNAQDYLQLNQVLAS